MKIVLFFLSIIAIIVIIILSFVFQITKKREQYAQNLFKVKYLKDVKENYMMEYIGKELQKGLYMADVVKRSGYIRVYYDKHEYIRYDSDKDFLKDWRFI